MHSNPSLLKTPATADVMKFILPIRKNKGDSRRRLRFRGGKLFRGSLVAVSFAAAAVCMLSVSALRADLLVIPADNGLSTPVVLRFDDRTGAFIDYFGHESEGYEAITQGPDEKIYVTSNTLGYGDIYRFNRNGTYLSNLTGPALRTPGALAFGPDGNCYVIGSTWPESPARWEIWRYNGTTGVVMNNFVTNAGAPRHLAFGRDGHLYVSDGNLGIVRYNGSTGASMGTFVPIGRGGLPDTRAFVFGPDANLYVASWSSNAVFRFNGTNGQFMSYFITPGSGGLSQPGGLAFGPDGNLYVSSTATHRILRFDARSGGSLGVFATSADMHYPTTLVFIPPAPRLQVKRMGTNVQISWPGVNSPQNWSLLTQRNGSPTGAWSPVTNSPVAIGTNWAVTDRCAGLCSFYRLDQR